MTDDKILIQEIDRVSRSIDEDWAKLAIKGLSPIERKSVREHLVRCNKTLKGLREQLYYLRKPGTSADQFPKSSRPHELQNSTIFQTDNA